MIKVGNIIRIKNWKGVAKEAHRGSIDLKYGEDTKGSFNLSDPMIVTNFTYFGDQLFDIQLSPITHPTVKLNLTSYMKGDFIIDLLAQVSFRVNCLKYKIKSKDIYE